MERKHRTQMTPAEITYIETLVHSINEWDLTTEHAEERMREKGIRKPDVVNTLKYGAVIEVKTNGRVLLRLMKGMMKGTCAVVNVKDRSVVTVWRNFGNDNHSTLDLSEYTWAGDSITLMRNLCPTAIA